MTAYETPEERRQRAGIVEVPVPGKSAKKLNGGSHPQPDAFPKKPKARLQSRLIFRKLAQHWAILNILSKLHSGQGPISASSRMAERLHQR